MVQIVPATKFKASFLQFTKSLVLDGTLFFQNWIVCPFIVIRSVLANDCQNFASISLCCRFSLAFFRRRAFLEDDSSRKSTFLGFWVFFLVLIVFSSTVNIVCINKTVLSTGDTYPIQIYLCEFKTCFGHFTAISKMEKMVGGCLPANVWWF